MWEHVLSNLGEVGHIWYALCISGWDEYILAPKGVFALFPAPLDEVF